MERYGRYVRILITVMTNYSSKNIFPLLWKSGGRFQTYFSKSILKPKCYVIYLKQTKKY